MKSLLKLLFVSAIILVSSVSHAAFVLGDVREEGDELSVLDTKTGIEWLNINETMGLSIDQVASELDSTYLGWRFPSVEEVDSIMAEIYGQTGRTIYENTSSLNYFNTMARYFGFNQRGTILEAKAMYYNGDYGESSYGSSEFLWSGFTASTINNKRTIIRHRNLLVESDVGSIGVGVFLVSDGGVTLSSIANPEINSNNANAPINGGTIPGGNVSDVSSPTGPLSMMVCLALITMRLKRKVHDNAV